MQLQFTLGKGFLLLSKKWPQEIGNVDMHFKLWNDLIDHRWTPKGNNEFTLQWKFPLYQVFHEQSLFFLPQICPSMHYLDSTSYQHLFPLLIHQYLSNWCCLMKELERFQNGQSKLLKALAWHSAQQHLMHHSKQQHSTRHLTFHSIKPKTS